VRLKADKLSKLTQSGKLFHIPTTLLEKKFVLTLLHLGLYNLWTQVLHFPWIWSQVSEAGWPWPYKDD